jgi:hypothetical protein
MAIINDPNLTSGEVTALKTAVNTANVSALTTSDAQAIYDYFASRQKDVEARQQRLLDAAGVWYESELRFCETLSAEGVTGVVLTTIQGVAWDKYDFLIGRGVTVEEPTFARPA